MIFRNVISLISLLGIVACGIWLRVHFAGEPIWVDETHSLWVTNSELAQVEFRAGQGNQTPVYFWLQYLAIWLFGNSTLALRALSVTSSSMSLVISGVIAWKWTKNPFCTALAAFLVATDNSLVFFGSEARPYALLQLLTLLQVYCVIEFLKRRSDPISSEQAKRAFVSTFGLSLLMIATHLTSILILLIEFVGALFLVRENKVNLWLAAALTLALTGGLYFTTLIAQVAAKKSDWSVVAPYAWLGNEFASTLFLLIITTVFSCLSLCKQNSQNQNGTTYSIALLSTFICATPILLVLFSIVTGFANLGSNKYISPLPVLAPLAVAIWISAIQSKALQGLVIVLTLTIHFALNPLAICFLNNQTPIYRQEDWRSVVLRLSESESWSSKPIFLFSNLVEDHRASTATDPKFLNYLKFPITAFDSKINVSTLNPMSTRPGITFWPESERQKLRLFGAARIVTRTTEPTRKAIIGELTRIFADKQLKVTTESQDGNRVIITYISFE
ncbi:MAG: hypothetical protein AAGA30_04100 [Planctomycetota bacterium]